MGRYIIVESYCVFVPEEIVLAANATLVGLCSCADFAMPDKNFLSVHGAERLGSRYSFKNTREFLLCAFKNTRQLTSDCPSGTQRCGQA
jgi:hypothetical protein